VKVFSVRSDTFQLFICKGRHESAPHDEINQPLPGTSNSKTFNSKNIFYLFFFTLQVTSVLFGAVLLGQIASLSKDLELSSGHSHIPSWL
jgi:hypothetical protein